MKINTFLVKPLKELNFPHNYEHKLKDADSALDKSSRKNYDKLFGVFLGHKTKVTLAYNS